MPPALVGIANPHLMMVPTHSEQACDLGHDKARSDLDRRSTRSGCESAPGPRRRDIGLERGVSNYLGGILCGESVVSRDCGNSSGIL